MQSNWLREVSKTYSQLNEFLIPPEIMAAAAKGVAAGNREVKKQKALDAAEKGFEGARSLKRTASDIKMKAIEYKEGSGLENPGREKQTEALINKFNDAAEAGKASFLRTAEKIKTGALIPSDYSTGRDPLRRELNQVSPEFKARYDARQARIDDIERKARAPIVTNKPKPTLRTEKPKPETREERLKRIGSMSKEERLEFIKQLNKPQ